MAAAPDGAYRVVQPGLGAVRPSGRRRADQAGGGDAGPGRLHVAAGVRVPDGVHLEPLPAYCPELQPAERLWPLTNEGVANRLFPTLDALEEALAERLVTLMAHLVRS